METFPKGRAGMKNSEAFEGDKEEHIQTLIEFLNVPRTAEEIEQNNSFRALAKLLHCSEESIQKAVTQLNWVSTRALPEPAVRNWVHHNGHIPESH